MRFTFTPTMGLCAQHNGQVLHLANFRVMLLRYHPNERMVQLFLTNHKGSNGDMTVRLEEMARPRFMKNRFLARGNYLWTGTEKVLLTYLEHLLKREGIALLKH